MDSIVKTLSELLILVPPILLAITFHEAAHGFAANFYGDDTAKRLGRLTLNPIAHVDRFGTIILPLMLFLLPGNLLFGYAKPVPVDVSRLRTPRWDMAKVAFAGPAMNFALAIVAVLAIPLAANLPTGLATTVLSMLDIFLFFNVLLGMFNLLPLPPLDGGRIVTAFLPVSLARPFMRLERFGIFLVIGLFFLVPMIGRQFGLQLEPFRALVLGPSEWVTKTLVGLLTQALS
ncbi:MAG: site-2 protease family protein [Pseudomonadota bacterium]